MTAIHGFNLQKGVDEQIYSDKNSQRVTGSLISYHWAGSGTGSAPDPTNFHNYTIGVDQNGVSGAAVYHVIDGAWVSVGATVANLYGG